MALKIVWSKRAEQGYDRIVRYLEEEWTEKEVQNFISETKYFFELLKTNPGILQPSKKKNLYRGPINRLTILTYRVIPGKKVIELVNIRGSRQKPLKS